MAFPFSQTLTRIFSRPAKAGAVRRFDGAAGGRRGFGMGTFHRINSEVAGAGATVRSRARYLSNNSPWLSLAVANWTGALVGAGIRVIGSQDDPATITRRQTDAMVIRMAGGSPADDVRPYMGLSA